MKIIRLTKTAKVPVYDKDIAGGLNVFVDSRQDIPIGAGEMLLLHTGILLEIPKGYYGVMYPLANISEKSVKGVKPTNGVNIIETKYKGELVVPIKNDLAFGHMIRADEPIAQLFIQPYIKAEIEEAEHFKGNGERKTPSAEKVYLF